MPTDDTLLTVPSPVELTPLEVSQAALEGEENPSPERMITPKERAAAGIEYGSERRPSSFARILLNPLVMWGAVAIGTGMIVAACARRNTYWRQ